MDFFKVVVKHMRDKTIRIYPDFTVTRPRDIMFRGGSFYAIWDEELGLWTTDSYRVVPIIDDAVRKKADEVRAQYPDAYLDVQYVDSYDSGRWTKFRNWSKDLSDSHIVLDDKLAWRNTEVKRTDYCSKRLPYDLAPGDISAWDEMVGTLYSPDERAKIEWAIGAIVAGDSHKIQKFMVLYGAAGTGKSTILGIIEDLFQGYTTTIDAAAIGNANKDFAMSMFKTNPLVAIQHDGDLSRITDNTKLNSLVSHEAVIVNEKYKASYEAASKAFLFIGTNSAVKITDRQAGLLRRLIDVEPTGNKIPKSHYQFLRKQINFELGAIAWHCREVYMQMGSKFYDNYVPEKMMIRTNIIYNFLYDNQEVIVSQDGGTIRHLYDMYKQYCIENGIDKFMPRYKFRDEMIPYFETLHTKRVEGSILQTFSGFKGFSSFDKTDEVTHVHTLNVDWNESIFDKHCEDYPAQYATEDGKPSKRWQYVKTTLQEINTHETHYVKVPYNHIVIDFDLRGSKGGKDLARNLEAAASWPATYAELSQSGHGVHLHYIYEGDPSLLQSQFAPGIEVKVFSGNASLRRKLTKCNRIPIATLTNSLPLKEKKVLKDNVIKSEKGLRDLIKRNLLKEIHPGTKPSVDFIYKILDDAYESGLQYDLTDMRGAVLSFAAGSTNRAAECIKTVQAMQFRGRDVVEPESTPEADPDAPLVFFDVEVFSNLFVVCWKYSGEDQPVVRMVNPAPADVEQLFKFKLVGFNNRRYDNHILYARYMGYDNEALYALSQKIIDNRREALFGEAYNLSYTDIYDFSSKKQGLKKFGIELGLHHVENDVPWDQPVPPEKVMSVVEYCVNDVLLTEAVFNSRSSDFDARLILAELSGLTPNHTTQAHTARIIFEGEKNTQQFMKYTDLSEMFEGYVYDAGVSTYRGETVGEGGYVYAEPGMYEAVLVLDVASMHPTSIVELDLFGKYTKNFEELMKARLAIKHKDTKAASKMLGGKLAPYLKDDANADALAYALKIVINIVYGLTSAKFDNPFRDNRNKDNIVAKRGALFMIDLKHALQDMGVQVIHIKTDSIKLQEPDLEVINFVMDFGRKYGYTFETEGVYEKFCLVNDAVYIARDVEHEWHAVGAQFQHPYVFKTLFSHELITFEDFCEPRSVMKGAMYLNYDLDNKTPTPEQMQFVGRTGLFVPVVNGGGVLYRHQDGKNYAVTGTKGYRWAEADIAVENNIDMSYFLRLADEAKTTIGQFGDFDEFARGE